MQLANIVVRSRWAKTASLDLKSFLNQFQGKCHYGTVTFFLTPQNAVGLMRSYQKTLFLWRGAVVCW